MRRRSILAATLILLAGAVARAETYGEKITAVDPAKHTLTIPVAGKDRTFKVDPKAEVKAQVRAGKRLRITAVKGGLKGVKAGSEATVETEKKDGEEVVTKIVVLVPAKK